jgi:hypothetical protein
MSVDQVGSSFLVDLVIFGLFQGWLIDSDLKRCGVALDESTLLRNVAKYSGVYSILRHGSIHDTATVLPIRRTK